MRYVILFKGLNVGGRHIVKMADLRTFLETLGCSRVKTYIQSGNAVCDTDLTENELAERIEAAFPERFGFDSLPFIRSKAAWQTLVERLPFDDGAIARAEANDPAVEHLYVFFARNSSDVDAIAEHDDVVVRGRDLYLLTNESILKSRSGTRLMKESALTARNWKTVLKLLDLVGTA